MVPKTKSLESIAIAISIIWRKPEERAQQREWVVDVDGMGEEWGVSYEVGSPLIDSWTEGRGVLEDYLVGVGLLRDGGRCNNDFPINKPPLQVQTNLERAPNP
jgi:hypothetical protein